MYFPARTAVLVAVICSMLVLVVPLGCSGVSESTFEIAVFEEPAAVVRVVAVNDARVRVRDNGDDSVYVDLDNPFGRKIEVNLYELSPTKSSRLVRHWQPLALTRVRATMVEARLEITLDNETISCAIVRPDVSVYASSTGMHLGCY